MTRYPITAHPLSPPPVAVHPIGGCAIICLLPRARAVCLAKLSTLRARQQTDGEAAEAEPSRTQTKEFLPAYLSPDRHEAAELVAMGT
eukprot:COSAG01_NODE_21513_length_898_cov_6.071339_1_plen_88_part_00